MPYDRAMRLRGRARPLLVAFASLVMAACDDSGGPPPNQRAGELMAEADQAEDPVEARALAERAIKILREHIEDTPGGETYWHARSQIVFAMQWIPEADVVGEFEDMVQVQRTQRADVDLFEVACTTALHLPAERNADAVRILRVTGEATGAPQQRIDTFVRLVEKR